MKDFKVIEVKRSIFEDNDADANKLRAELKEEGTFLLNLMSSPGAGKTTTLKRTIAMLKDEMSIGIMEADIDSDVDAKAIAETGVRAIQIHTGGMCHLDADMTRQGIHEFGTKDLDFVVLENVGNLVCPAEFDTGSTKNAMILSVPEGDDKPLKYPLMFTISDVVLINKCDTLCVFDDFSKEEVEKHLDKAIIAISAKENTGITELEDKIKEMFFHGEVSFNDEVYITNIRQKNSLQDALDSLNLVVQSIEDDMPEDFYSIDLMSAYESLGKMIGESVEDDLVNEIFSKFCMGK